MEDDETAEGLSLEQAWRAWGPPELVRELDAVGFPDLGDEIREQMDAQHFQILGRFLGENPPSISPAKAAASEARRWLQEEVRSGRLELIVKDGPAWFATDRICPASEASFLEIIDGWRLTWDGRVQHRPRLRAAGLATPTMSASANQAELPTPSVLGGQTTGKSFSSAAENRLGQWVMDQFKQSDGLYRSTVEAAAKIEFPNMTGEAFKRRWKAAIRINENKAKSKVGRPPEIK